MVEIVHIKIIFKVCKSIKVGKNPKIKIVLLWTLLSIKVPR